MVNLSRRSRALFLLIALLQFSTIIARSKFKDQIPNGNKVPHSCDRTQIWSGVGHESPLGSGPFNQFGRDFQSANLTWTKALCQLDSDGDGKRNGVELGDPDCVWTPGQTPAVTNVSLLSHPGICEPLDSTGCQAKNTFLPAKGACAAFVNKTDWCPAISGKDVKKLVLRFNEVNIPANDTSYMCQIFDLPSDDDYQIIAWEPLVVNVEIMHHLVSFVCDNPDDIRQLQAMKPDYYKNPVVCGMSPVCKTFSMTWAFGVPPRCYDNQIGIPFGKSFYNKTILQIHYNNPEQKPFFKDSSGVVVYYTKATRPQNVGSIVVGQMDVRLPPKTPWSLVSGGSLGDNCTVQRMAVVPQYNITSMLFHMHKMGVYGKLLLRKKTGKVLTLVDRNITYDRPALLSWTGADSIGLEAGDSIYIECGFNTSTRSNWTFFGERTSDEMCLAVVEVYPLIGKKMSLSSTSYGPYDSCSLRNPIIGNCSMIDFRSTLNYTKVNKLGSFEASCACRGTYPVPSCSSDCYSFLNRTGFLALSTCLNNTYLMKVAGLTYDYSIIDSIASQLQQCASLSRPPADGATCTSSPSKLSAHHENYDSGDETGGVTTTKSGSSGIIPLPIMSTFAVTFNLILLFAFIC